MSARIFTLVLTSTVVLTACATAQENPHYQHSTKYKGDTPYANSAPVQYAQQTPQTTPATYQSSTYSQPAYTAPQPTPSNYQRVETSPAAYQPMNTTQASYQRVETPVYAQATPTYASTASYTRLDHRCLRKEMNHQLIGGAVGGTAGAFIGKEVIGGTKGTIAGAALGGAAGYGIGDKTVNCDPVTVPIAQHSAQVTPAYYSNGTSQQPVQPLYASSQTTTTRVIAPTDAAMPDSYGTPGYQAMQNSQNTRPPQAPVQQPVKYAPQPSSQAMFHTVRKGDTVYSLARSLCTNIEDVQMMNGLNQDFSIRLGDTIKLPSSKC